MSEPEPTYPKKIAYTWKFNHSEGDAIFWHGYRYLFTERLSEHLTQDEDEQGYTAELTEPEAWELRDTWEQDGETLACGAPELIAKIAELISQII